MADLVDRADWAWPRRRVALDRFRQNVESMALQCERAGMALCIVPRPRNRLLEGSRSFYCSKPLERRDYADLVGTPDRAAIYDEIHRLYTEIQREVAGARQDACHLYEFAEQQMAEYVALTVAPHHRERTAQYFAGLDYNARTACLMLPE